MRENVGVDVCDGSQTEDCVVFRAVGVEPGVWVGSGRLAKGDHALPLQWRGISVRRGSIRCRPGYMCELCCRDPIVVGLNWNC